METVQSLVEALQTVLKPEVLGALTGAPFVLQWVRKLFPQFTGEWAAVLSPVISAALVLSQAWGLCSPGCMVFQIVVGWIYIELVYVRVVEPMAKSSNPLVPNA